MGLEERDRIRLRKIRGSTAADNRELSKVLESMLTRGDKPDRIIAEGAAVKMRRQQPANEIAEEMLDNEITSPRRYNRMVRVHGETVDLPQFDGIVLKSQGEGDFYIRRVGPNAGKVTKERNGPSDIAVTVDEEASGMMPEYTMYLMMSLEGRLKSRLRGSVQQSIRQQDVYEILGEQLVPPSRIAEMRKQMEIFSAAQQMSQEEAKYFLQNLSEMPVAHNPETGETKIMFEQRAKLQEAIRIAQEAAESEGMGFDQWIWRGSGPRRDRTYMKRRYNNRRTPFYSGVPEQKGVRTEMFGSKATHIYNNITGNIILNNRRNRLSITRQQIKAGYRPSNYVVGSERDLRLFRGDYD